MNDNKQVGGNAVAIKEPREGFANNNVIIQGFGKDWQYSRPWTTAKITIVN